MPHRLLFSIILFAAAAPGCAPERDTGSSNPDPDMNQVTFAAKLGVDLSQMARTGSGLHYRELQAGTGAEAAPGHQVTVHYTGWLPDGTKFDSSRDRNEPFSFGLGKRNVIAGWEEGVAGMKVGGSRRLVIPPSLGYGSRGYPPVIPPNSVLVFDVELLGVK